MLHITRRAHLMMQYAVEKRPNTEISGLGRIALEAGDAVLLDILIPPQIVTSGSVDVGPERLTDLMLYLRERGQLLKEWPIWWHSHPGTGSTGMGSSTTDDRTLQALATELGGWAVGLITNKGGNYYAWLALTVPWVMDVRIDTTLQPDRNPRWERAVDAMLEHVTHAAPVSRSGGQAFRGHAVNCNCTSCCYSRSNPDGMETGWPLTGGLGGAERVLLPSDGDEMSNDEKEAWAAMILDGSIPDEDYRSTTTDARRGILTAAEAAAEAQKEG